MILPFFAETIGFKAALSAARGTKKSDSKHFWSPTGSSNSLNDPDTSTMMMNASVLVYFSRSDVNTVSALSRSPNSELAVDRFFPLSNSDARHSPFRQSTKKTLPNCESISAVAQPRLLDARKATFILLPYERDDVSRMNRQAIIDRYFSTPRLVHNHYPCLVPKRNSPLRLQSYPRFQ